jgi:hypothetical protein
VRSSTTAIILAVLSNGWPATPGLRSLGLLRLTSVVLLDDVQRMYRLSPVVGNPFPPLLPFL